MAIFPTVRDAKKVLQDSGTASLGFAAPNFDSVYIRKLYTTVQDLRSFIQPCVWTVLWTEISIWPVFPKFHVQIKHI